MNPTLGAKTDPQAICKHPDEEGPNTAPRSRYMKLLAQQQPGQLALLQTAHMPGPAPGKLLAPSPGSPGHARLDTELLWLVLRSENNPCTTLFTSLQQPTDLSDEDFD